MQEGARETLQRLIYHTHPNDFESYLKFFDEKERTQLSIIPKVEKPIALHLDSESEKLHNFHYSWYISIISACPKELQRELLTLFTPQQQAKLEKHLKVKTSTKKVNPLIEKFFTHKILKQLGYQQLPPECLFSHSPHFYLLKISKKDLVYILHRLGILDIANMAKKIVDKKTLKDLFKFFTRDQKKWFKEAQKTYIEPLASSTKDIKRCLEDDRSFINFLEKRGILRLSMSLANENSFLVWNLAHILDKGRGEEFLSVVRRCVPSGHTPFYTKQLSDICKPFKEKES